MIVAVGAALAQCSAGADILVTSTSNAGPGSLTQAIITANAATSSQTITITATGTLSLSAPIPAITNPFGMTINGPVDGQGNPAFVINGQGSNRGLFVFATDAATQTARGSVQISNLKVINCVAQGGNGGPGHDGGGGGAGLGGGFFLGQGNVTLTNMVFNNNTATGGNGGGYLTGNMGEGGGGGMGGVGGPGADQGGPNQLTYNGGGGGVGNINGALGAGGIFGGLSGYLTGFPGGGKNANGDLGGTDAGGGAGSSNTDFQAAGGGVAGQDASSSTTGGAGGFGGGSGGGLIGVNGGYGGGAGGYSIYLSASTGQGGFGGGGGGGVIGMNAGFGGGRGGTRAGQFLFAGGGGGLGAGGAAFIRAGNSLFLQDCSISANSVSPGLGAASFPGTFAIDGHNGAALGQGVFLGGDLVLSVSAGKTMNLADNLSGGNDPEANGELFKFGAGTVVLSSANSYTGGTQILSGTLSIAHFAALGSGEVDLSNGGILRLNPTLNTAVKVPVMSILGSTTAVDMTNNALILSSGSLATVGAWVSQGYAGGAWSGAGITSSTAATIAAGASVHKTAIGYAQASAVLAGGSTFLGQSVSGSEILLRYTLVGDENLDGVVNSTDFSVLASRFESAGQTWVTGDFNFDGVVNALDFNALATNYGAALASPPAIAALVPDPICVALVIPMMALRRRALRLLVARAPRPRISSGQ
jgi:hypothetical protein